MLSVPLNLGSVEVSQLFDFLYAFFHRDFVANQTKLNGTIQIDPQSQRIEDGKEMSFWHLTSRNQERPQKQGNRYVMIKERLPDYRRAERIEWVKQIITGCGQPAVRCFYHQETNAKRDIRLYLWAYQDDFVVILQRLGKSSSFLVTSFYIDHPRKRSDFLARYQRYLSKAAPELKGCEWY